MCSVDSDDTETAKVWCETPRRAAKLHHCAGCGVPIRPGEAYLDHRSFSDGWWTEAACFWCWWTRDMFVDAHGSQLFVFSQLHQTLLDCIGENDDPEDVWRPVLAALWWRHHRSPAHLRRIHRREVARALAEEIAIERAAGALDHIVIQEHP